MHSATQGVPARPGLVWRLDARVKLILLGLFSGSVLALRARAWLPLAFYSVVLVAALGGSRIRVRALIPKMLLAVVALLGIVLFSRAQGGLLLGGAPFIAGGVDLAWRVLLISWAGIVVSLTTPVWEIASGMRSVGCPPFLLALFSLMIRYVFVLGDEIVTVRRALASRGGFPRQPARRLAALAHTSSSLLLRTYERAEQVATAMESRRYQGHFPSLRLAELSFREVAWGAAGGVIVLGPVVWAWLGK